MRELSLNVMDIAQNSISAGASLITIQVVEDVPGDLLSISVTDNGCGMTKEQVEHVIDPFYTTRTTRSVGLGVPLFKMEAEMTGGSFVIDSEKGKGTTLTASFKPSSVDMIPLGDISGTVQLLISCNPDRDFLFTRHGGGGRDTAGLRPGHQGAAAGAGGRRAPGLARRGAVDQGVFGGTDRGTAQAVLLNGFDPSI